MKTATLVFFCGKMGSGKSTRSKQIARERGAVWLCEDEWLESLYPGRISSLEDYVKYSSLLKPRMKELVQSLLSAGADVVMDFPANTVSQRDWFRGIFTEAGASHELVYLTATDEVCLEQIKKRRTEQPERARTDTAEMFEQVSRHFTEPAPEEGFNVTKEG
jgi:predicted kinase